MLVAAVSVGIVAIPAILVLWSISGLFNMTIGTCAESAPLFYCVTLAAMLAQIAAIVNAARINVSTYWHVKGADNGPHHCILRWRQLDTMSATLNAQFMNAPRR